MQQPIYQHNWTGALALYVTSPAQPLLNAAVVKGVNHNSKASKGTWLKAANHARLRLVEHQEQQGEQHSITSMLELRLQETLLVQCPLLHQQLSLCIIPSSSTSNSGSILVLRTKQQQQQQQQAPVWCFRFYDAPDCNSFKSALQAMLHSMHSRTLQQQQRQQQQQEQLLQQQRREEAVAMSARVSRSNMDVAELAAPAAAGSSGEKTQLVDSSGAIGTGAAAPAGAPSAGAPSAGAPSDAHVKDMIRHYLLDPAFQSLVEQVDALWDEVEQEVDAMV